MLSDYYREDGERLYDMNFMATNFVSTFDPFMTFTDDPDFVGAMNTSGMTDEQLIDMTWDMHKTEPYDVLTYEQKWIEFQKYYNELLPTMPIYSNVYFDFHTNWLQNYYAGSEINWPEAVLYAYIAEPVETAPDEVQSGLDLDDDMKIDGGNDFGDDDFESSSNRSNTRYIKRTPSMAGRPRKGFNVLGKKRRSELHQMKHLKEQDIRQPIVCDDGNQIVDGRNQRAGSYGGIDVNLFEEHRHSGAHKAGKHHGEHQRRARAPGDAQGIEQRFALEQPDVQPDEHERQKAKHQAAEKCRRAFP